MSDLLFVLAFDHRASLPSTLGLTQTVEEARGTLEQTKEIAFEGLCLAAQHLTGGERALLVDEQLGADVARKVKDSGLSLAMPVERSGEEYFAFQYPDWQDHILAFDPDLVKVLVRWNPDGDGAGNARQGRALAELSRWCVDFSRPLMLELLVPATDSQRAADHDHLYDTTIRPGLAATAMQQLREAGVEPEIWKLEGVDARDDAVRLVETAREGGRDRVRCVILGRGADDAQVDEWLRVGAGVPGFIGFAIGRSIWAGPLKAWLNQELSEHAAAEAIASNYSHFVSVYESADG